jgi:acetate kinase
VRILVLNGGSSSLKGALWELPAGPPPSKAPARSWEVHVGWGRHPGQADVTGAGERSIPIRSPQDAFEPVLDTLPPGRVDAVGHRIVHGGAEFRDAVRITPAVRESIAKLAEFAPEHNAIEVAVIDAVTHKLGADISQIAVFDTAFHATLPEPAYVYPGPFEWLESGIRRYGFHGISYQYVSRRVSEILGRGLTGLRIVACHLGNGCSLCAIQDGRSVDTTMGFTPLEGLMMGTRSGSIDPGICVYLMRHGGRTADDLDRMLNTQSGLKGISGMSADMREIVNSRDNASPRAKLAFDIFVHRLCREMGGMLASLGGMDALVFTGGIGENSAALRTAVCERFGFVGVRMDAAKNEASPVDRDIASEESAVRVLVVATDEDWEIARECVRLHL